MVNSVTNVYPATSTCEQTIQPAVIRVFALASLTSVWPPPGDETWYHNQSVLFHSKVQ